MANKSKAKGTVQESKLRDDANSFAGEVVCERVALHGNHDHGDLKMVVPSRGLTLSGESKKRSDFPSESEIDDFKQQTVTQNENAGYDGGVLIVNLPHKSMERWPVYMQRSTYLKLTGEGNDDDWVSITWGDFKRICWEGGCGE